MIDFKNIEILLVEDDGNDAQLARRLLAKNNLATYTRWLPDGPTLLTYLEGLSEMERKTTSRVVLLDINLPGMDGFEILRRLRQEYSMHELPILVLSVRGEREDVAKALILQANDFVTKPLNAMVLLTRINTQLALQQFSRAGLEALNVVSHDLKKPLLVIADVLDELRETYPVGSTVSGDTHELFGILANTTSFMRRMVQNYLDISCIARGSLKLEESTVDLNTLARAVVANNTGYASRQNQQLRLELAESLPAVVGDELRLSEVIENLVGNAIKFSAAGALATVRTEARDGQVRVMVHDQGPGLSPADLDNAFENRFAMLGSRPTGAEKSSGLGLSICKQVIGLHHGRMGMCNNDPPPGATFWFELPVRTEPSGERADH